MRVLPGLGAGCAGHVGHEDGVLLEGLLELSGGGEGRAPSL